MGHKSIYLGGWRTKHVACFPAANRVHSHVHFLRLLDLVLAVVQWREKRKNARRLFCLLVALFLCVIWPPPLVCRRRCRRCKGRLQESLKD